MANTQTISDQIEGQPSPADTAANEEPRAPENAVWSPADLAGYLRVDVRVIYVMIRERQLPGVRPIGRQYRIDRDVVLKWLADGQGRAPRSTPRS
jgi:excisionase family DNA binding protein